jgi:sporulation protein YlmC with PRC-barrel domain
MGQNHQEHMMLCKTSILKGYTIAASDGRIGTVSDLLFDDSNWQVRWLVVDTGNWLSGRKVLLRPKFLEQLDPKHHEFGFALTMQQVKDSPDVDTDLPVSRQTETDIYHYYGWSPYWGDGLFTDSYGYAGGDWRVNPALGSISSASLIAGDQKNSDDPHLRSIQAVTGYYIGATDGEIGHIDDFILEDADWSIHYLIVDTKNWWFGKKVLISTQSAKQIDWADKCVHLNVDCQKVKDSPVYDASTLVDAAYDDAFLTYYGIRLVAA